MENVYIYNNIAMIFMRQSRFFEAIELHHKCLDIQLNNTAPLYDQQTLIVSYSNLATAYFENDQNDAALDYFHEASDIAVMVLPAQHALCKSIQSMINDVEMKINRSSSSAHATVADCGHAKAPIQRFIFSKHVSFVDQC